MHCIMHRYYSLFCFDLLLSIYPQFRICVGELKYLELLNSGKMRCMMSLEVIAQNEERLEAVQPRTQSGCIYNLE